MGNDDTFRQKQIDELKSELKDKNAPFGVDLLLPQVGGNARKTNYDYTKGAGPGNAASILQLSPTSCRQAE